MLQGTKNLLAIYKTIFLQVCKVFCGMSKEAGKASYMAFLKWNKVFDVDTSFNNNSILAGMVDCYVKAKQNFIEKRVIRAFLCWYFCHAQLQQLWDVVPGFVIS